MRALIVVLGDLGRSPRMQYHALALAEAGTEVDVFAYHGTDTYRTVSSHPKIRLHRISPMSSRSQALSRPLFVTYASARMMALGVRLLWMMLIIERPDVILVQNPPAMPALLVCLVAARIRSSRLVVDWHNFSHSMLALRMGAGSRIVQMLRCVEIALGKLADAHFCVSAAMKTVLAEQWGFRNVFVFRDRPSTAFSPTLPESRMEVVQRCLDGEIQAAGSSRPAILVCPTGWTEDEDLSILIEAATRYDEQASRQEGVAGLPPLLILISGRGPLQGEFKARIDRTKLDKVSIRTLWLPPEDYALLVGSADLGVSCHRSASGVDLAMKVADLFGAGVPVCALDYGACLAEQVRHGENGLIFKTSQELAAQFRDLLRGFPAETPLLKSLRGNLARSQSERWNDGWKAEAAPVLFN